MAITTVKHESPLSLGQRSVSFRATPSTSFNRSEYRRFTESCFSTRSEWGKQLGARPTRRLPHSHCGRLLARTRLPEGSSRARGQVLQVRRPKRKEEQERGVWRRRRNVYREQQRTSSHCWRRWWCWGQRTRSVPFLTAVNTGQTLSVSFLSVS